MFEQDNTKKISIPVGEKSREKQFWMEKLSGDWQKCVFPYDYRGRDRKSRRMETVLFNLEDELFQGLWKLCNRSDLRLHIILVTGVAALLSRYTGYRDIILGMPIYKQQVEGEFINTVLILRNKLEEHCSFKDLLLQMSKTISEANDHVNYPLETLLYNMDMQLSDDDFPLFDIAVLLENIHKEEDIRHLNLNMVFALDRKERGIEGRLVYNVFRYERTAVQQVTARFRELLRQAVNNINIQLPDIELLLEGEKRQLLEDLNQTITDFPREQSLAGLFEEQVGRFPGNQAVKSGNRDLTYRELNNHANRLARLLEAKGVRNNTIVGLLTDHSPEMIVGIMGILKTGGAYLPIDPEFPEDRLRYMLAESHTHLLLIQREFRERMDYPVETMALEMAEIYEGGDESDTAPRARGEDLAYVIYTSGTTGQPKGSLIQQRSVSRVVKNTNLVDLDEHDRMLLLSNYAFDGSVYDIFGALLNGGASVLIARADVLRLDKLCETIEKEKITGFFITSSLFNTLVEERIECFRDVRKIVVGGEKVSVEHTRKALDFLGKGRLINGYGPTESTVFAICHHIDGVDERRSSVPIGKPISNTQVYILGRDMRPQPVGVPGEIFIGGDGLSRGYLNNPDLTNDRFPGNPFAPGSFLYRTGDLGRYLPDGDIEFLERIDGQVKLRGFRVELGEIENQLLRHEKVKEAVVLVKEDNRKNMILCAYIVASVEVSLADLKAHLEEKLPDFMVPANFIILEKFPLTANGKIDYRSLPEPQGKTLEGQVKYEAPRSDVERKLVEIWEEVLGQKNIGIHDDFFLLGGDSIVTIQVISRMAREGYKVDMRDIFSNPTIEKLAKFAESVRRVAPQSEVTGEIPLTPNQCWFFAEIATDPHHFNQSMTLRSERRFDEETVKAIFQEILAHHDALRIHFEKRGGEIVQINGGTGDPPSLEIIDLRKEREFEATFNRHADRFQGSIDLENGPLMKLVIFRLPHEDRLLIVVHHLVVDAVSWRILLEDIEILYQQLKKGETPQLPLKSDSFRAWSEKLRAYADSESFLEERDFWEAQEQSDVAPIQRDFDRAFSRVKTADSRSFQLSEAATQRLMTRANQAYGTGSRDLLVTALALAVRQTFGNPRVVIDLEGHGREGVIDDISVERTVGWFTAVYPIVLDVSHEDRLGRQIKEIKEYLRRVPQNGRGYGILRYLTSKEHKKGLSFQLPRQISFNYLGQFDGGTPMTFGTPWEATGAQQGLEGERPFELDIWAMVVGRRLKFTANFSREQYRVETIDTLMNHLREILDTVISHCCDRQAGELTPSDLTYKDLSIDEVEDLSAMFDAQEG